MTQLIPCPGCNRHVRQAESSCPFCSAQLSLSHLPEHALPRTRLGRAATFAFGATLVGATALVGCGGESEGKKEGGGGTGGTAQAGSSSGGSNAGQNAGGTGITPVYGAPAAGTGNAAGSSSGGNQGTAGFGAGGGPVYGAPAAGSGNMGGFTGIPVYGAAPAD